MLIDYLKKYEKKSIVVSIVLIVVAIFLIAKPGMALTTAVIWSNIFNRRDYKNNILYDGRTRS